MLLFQAKKLKYLILSLIFLPPAFTHLKDHGLFTKCYISCGFVTWDENTDISTDLLYFEGIKLEDYYK